MAARASSATTLSSSDKVCLADALGHADELFEFQLQMLPTGLYLHFLRFLDLNEVAETRRVAKSFQQRAQRFFELLDDR
jgi:hypothetical protein